MIEKTSYTYRYQTPQSTYKEDFNYAALGVPTLATAKGEETIFYDTGYHTSADSRDVMGFDEDTWIWMHTLFSRFVFEFDDTVVVSRLIEGEYFRIEQMLSNDYETKVRINKRELLNCIDRATLLVKEGDKKPIIINIQDEMMELKIKSEKGTMDEEIMITKEGKDLLIGFNPKFLIDALRVIDDEEVDLYFMNAKAPCFIKDEGESYVYLILPVNFSGAV